jgi:hypothetical protein
MKMNKNTANKEIDKIALDDKDSRNKKHPPSSLIEYDKDVLDYILGGCDPVLSEHTV